MIGLRNDHSYGEPLEFRRIRLEVQADERHAVDSWHLPDDRVSEHEPAPRWFRDPLAPICASPEALVVVGSRRTDAASLPSEAHAWGAAQQDSAAGAWNPPAAHPSADRKAT